MPVIVLRSPTDGWREGLRNRFLRQTLKALRLAQAYIVGTEWLKSELATWLGDDKRISVVPFGVDRAFFSEAPGARTRGRSDWRIPESAFVVLHVGSTVERKNVPLVIQTVARLRNEADAYLLQVGGRFTGDQEQQIERLGLRRYVRSLPAADETTLRRAYRAADVLLFPSLYRSEEHTSELQSLAYLVCRLLLEKKKRRADAAVAIPSRIEVKRARAIAS